MRTNGKRVLGLFALTMINVCAIQSLRNFPLMAEIGLAALFFYAAAALFFFIPCALVAAELAAGWPSMGGIYTWVKEAYGDKTGFVAIWLQWIENIIWYPTVLSFAAGSAAYLFDPHLADDKLYIFLTVLLIYWSCTLIDFWGMRISAFISSLGVIIGTIIPAVFIVSLGVLWILSGNSPQISFNPKNIFPDFGNIQNIVFLVGVKLALSGIEMSAVHAKEVKNPQRDYPKAIFLSVIIIFLLSVSGSLAIAAVVPRKEISLVAGVMQAFNLFFEAYNIEWLTPIFSFLITFGTITMVSTWIIGPSKGIFQTAREGHLPPFLHKVNRRGVPTAILASQGLTVSAISFAFLFMPSISSSYWLLVNLSAILYLMMYALMFLSAIKLRRDKPNVKRAYRVPAINLIAGTGLISTLFAIIIGFVPPLNLAPEFYFRFEAFLIGGTLLMLAVPLIICANQKESWKIKSPEKSDD